jgi:putative flippase GtrA
VTWTAQPPDGEADVPWPLFTGVIVWEGVATLLFWQAGWTFRGRGSGRKVVYLAFTASLVLWGGFLMADEVFVAFPLESTHLRLFIANLLTLLAIELLPEE